MSKPLAEIIESLIDAHSVIDVLTAIEPNYVLYNGDTTCCVVRACDE